MLVFFATACGEATAALRHTSCGWCGASKRERPTGHEAIRLSLWQRRLLCTNDSINPDPDVPFTPPRPPKKFAMSADNKSHRLYVKGKHISYQRGKVCAHRIRVLTLPF